MIPRTHCSATVGNILYTFGEAILYTGVLINVVNQVWNHLLQDELYWHILPWDYVLNQLVDGLYDEILLLDFRELLTLVSGAHHFHQKECKAASIQLAVLEELLDIVDFILELFAWEGLFQRLRC
jgi:hypothetical protein